MNVLDDVIPVKMGILSILTKNTINLRAKMRPLFSLNVESE